MSYNCCCLLTVTVEAKWVEIKIWFIISWQLVLFTYFDSIFYNYFIITIVDNLSTAHPNFIKKLNVQTIVHKILTTNRRTFKICFSK